MSVSFRHSFLAGLGVAASIAAGMFVTLLLLGAVEDGFLSIFLMIGVMAVAFAGAVITGALVGVVAARNAPNRGTATGAAALSALLGQFLILLFVFLGAAIAFSGDADTTDDALAAGDDEAIAWSEFGSALLFLLPAVVTAAATAPATFRFNTGGTATKAPGAVHAAPSTLPDHTHETTARRLTCPRCRTVNNIPGTASRFACMSCGTRGQTA